MNESWAHGYYAEEGYVYGFYYETMPAHIRWACALQGADAPGNNFTFLDLGCGQGFSLIVSAIFHPESKFIGVDFMPRHIAHANQLAKAAGVTNVIFIEGDFLDLAQNADQIGPVDYAVAHGISTWVAPEVTEAMFKLAEKVLKPGGVMYNSYNAYPGWYDASPFQQLVSLEMRSKSGVEAIAGAVDLMGKLKGANAKLFGSLPGLDNRLEALKTAYSSYLVQEYNNKNWQPRYVGEMIDVAYRHKLEYAGTANLCEAIESSYSAEARDLIAQQKDLKTRETVRDFLINQCFRRDLYVKGFKPLWSTKKTELLGTQRFVPLSYQPRPEVGKPFEFFQGHLHLSTERETFLEVLNAFESTGSSVSEVHAKVPQHTLLEIAEMTSYLYFGGWLALHNNSGSAAVKRLNHTLLNAHLNGAPYNQLASGLASTVMRLSDAQMMICAIHQKGVSREDLPRVLMSALIDLDRKFGIDGKLLDGPEGEQEAQKHVDHFFAEVLPELLRMEMI